MENQLDRRSFLKKAGTTALSATALTLAKPIIEAQEAPDASFRSSWAANVNRTWPGPEYWANPLQDWRVRQGKLECFRAGGDRNVALLTREVAARSGDLALRVRVGKIGSDPLERGFVGFRVGIKAAHGDYRTAAIYGRGMNAGIHANGHLFIGETEEASARIDLNTEVQLEFRAQPSAKGYSITLRASNDRHDSAHVQREVPADWIVGGLALVCSSAAVEPTPAPPAPIKDFDWYPPQQQRGGTMRFWFADWVISGSKVDAHQDRAYGPILFTLYTVSHGVLKLSAQFPPLGDAIGPAVLQTRDAQGKWLSIATAQPDPDAWNATFRISGWDASRETEYRVLYTLDRETQQERQFSYEGIITADPETKPDVVIGLLTCIWDFGFPHTDFTTHLAFHRPDILFWTGDQIYEPVGGYGVLETRSPDLLEPAMHDFLRKWYIFGWAVRDLTRRIPSVCMTDDHDMFHGNIWGCGGRPTNPALPEEGYEGQDSGGYKMPPRWVNMVQRSQTAHLPDPFDSSPVEQQISVYYTHLRWGGISFAILEDRKWKSAPKEQLPGAQIRNGFALNPNWDPALQSDVPTAELLGERQLNFLEYWATDWSSGTWMKFAVTQTPFGCLHTEPEGIVDDKKDPTEDIPPVGVYLRGDHVIADHDSAGWPQAGRNAAIRKLVKGFAAHLNGDQHLGTTCHYGIDEFRDGVYSVCTPAVSNIWPRRWFPPNAGRNALPGKPNTGDHQDAFGNRMTVLALANPARFDGPGLDGLRHRVTGYTILTCNRATRKTTVAEWPRWVDPSAPGAMPYDGWPITIDQLNNGLCAAEWQLTSIDSGTHRDPVVQVRDEATGEVVYTIRISGTEFTPPVRKPGAYSVLAYDPDGDYYKKWSNIQARRKA